jgi:hypothetical protein
MKMNNDACGAVKLVELSRIMCSPARGPLMLAVLFECGPSYLLAAMHKRALLPEVVCSNACEDLMLVTLSYQWCAFACTSELKNLWACGALLFVEAWSANCLEH